ncbi:MAG: glycosyltransferase family 4 protein [Desulfuromonadales bacterium]
MRVCLIAPIPPFRGGIAKYCYSLAQELEKRHDLPLLSYSRQYPELLYGRKSQLDPAYDSQKIDSEFKQLSYDIDSASIFSWLETSRKIADFNPNLVILPWWVAYWAPMYAYLLSSFKKKNINVVFLCINIFEHEDNIIKKLVTTFVLKKVNSIIVHSEQEKNSAIKINPKAEVRKHLLPLFEYEPVPAAKQEQTTLQMLFFGFVRPYKGLDVLLKAICILKDRNISLKIVGEFWNDKDEHLKIMDEYGISGKVEIIDRYVSDQEMIRYFTESDVVVLPYKKSITSGVIATAYGFNKPVLATNVGGFYEVILENVTGKIVQPDDPKSLADGIEWFLSNRLVDFAENIAEFTAEKMSWKSLVDVVEEFDIKSEGRTDEG